MSAKLCRPCFAFVARSMTQQPKNVFHLSSRNAKWSVSEHWTVDSVFCYLYPKKRTDVCRCFTTSCTRPWPTSEDSIQKLTVLSKARTSTWLIVPNRLLTVSSSLAFSHWRTTNRWKRPRKSEPKWKNWLTTLLKLIGTRHIFEFVSIQYTSALTKNYGQ